MKEGLVKLLKLKSIITMIMIIALIIGWFMNKVTNEQFIPLVTTIITFYFAKQEKVEER
ncbi:hypothetical protein [Holdemania massiliensis]|uniref:hypothetical protein n=1 Tax=Holdemania massiliensis TaxID=1468449 RepID=UPI0035211E0A